MDRISEIFKDKGGVFQKLKNWIENGPGFMVYGGTRYLEELYRMPRKLNLIKQLKTFRPAGVVILKRSLVDDKEVKLKRDYSYEFRLLSGGDGDPHIVAICQLSKTKLLCSNDGRCKSNIKKIFTKNRPKFYEADARNSDLLAPQIIVDIASGLRE